MKHLNTTRAKYGFKVFSGGILLFCSWACNGDCLIRNGIWFSAVKSKRDPTKCLEDRKHTFRSSLIDQSPAILRVSLCANQYPRFATVSMRQSPPHDQAPRPINLLHPIYLHSIRLSLAWLQGDGAQECQFCEGRESEHMVLL